MGDSIQERIGNLARFQNLELVIARTRRQLDETGPRIEALEQGLQRYQQAVKTATERISDLKKRYRESEREVQANIEKISKSQAKLMQVKTNKEYRSSLKEIEGMQEANSEMEDRMLVMLDEIEEAEASLKIKQSDCDRESREISQEQKTVTAEAKTLTQTLERLEKEIDVAAGKVDAQLMTTYLQVRAKQADGIGLAGVRKAVCQGCYVNIRPQLFNDMQRWDTVYTCPNCQRIIYWDNSEEKAEGGEAEGGRLKAEGGR